MKNKQELKEEIEFLRASTNDLLSHINILGKRIKKLQEDLKK